MRVLLCNDDGIDAPGLQCLEEVATEFGEVMVVAPSEEQSAMSHAFSLRRPLRAIQRSDHHWAVTGTPADCVYLALKALLSEPPDLILSGVNHGSNLGKDVPYSGTAAAAREGCFGGIPSIAFSLFTEPGGPVRWDTAAHCVRDVLKRFHPGGSIHPDTFLNVNIPNIPIPELRGVKTTELGKRFYEERTERRTDIRGKAYYWIGGPHSHFEGGPDTDGIAVAEGWVSVSPVHTLPTHYPSLSAVRDWTDA